MRKGNVGMLHGKKLVVRARDIKAEEMKLSRTCLFKRLEWLIILKIHSFHKLEQIIIRHSNN